MSDSVRPHRRQPTRPRRPWDSPGKNTGVGCHFFLQCMKVKSESEVARSCLTLSDLMDCSLPGSSVHGIFQARVLEWGAIAFSDVSSISVIYSTYSFLSTQRRSFQPVCYIGATTFMVASGDLQNTQESVGLQPARSVNTQGQNCR